MAFSSGSISATLLKWPTELLSNVLQCFHTPRASRRESEWFDMDSAVEREDTMDGLEVVRAWFTINPDFPPEHIVRHHGVFDIVKAIISLECQRGGEELVELIVPETDAAMVRRQFNIEMALPLGSRDPMVLSQKPEVLALQKFEAGQKLLRVYRAYQAKGDIDDQARTWLHRRLQWVSNELDTLLNSIYTVRAWKTICQGPLMRNAKGVEPLILAEVHLEDPCNAYDPAPAIYRPNGAIQVDLVVQKGDVAAVCTAYPPVNFASFSDGDPLVFAYPHGDNNTKRVLALSEVLSRYRRVYGSRQSQVQEQERKTDNDLISYWYTKKIEQLEGYFKKTHGCETHLIWYRNHQLYLMTDIRSKGLQDVVIAAVPLQEPNYQRVSDDQTMHPDGAILVEIAIRVGGGPRVLREYGLVEFDPMSDKDPVVLTQQGDNMDAKRVAAYKDLAARYSRYLSEECPRLNPMARAWATERLARIQYQISVLQPSPLVTIRICYPNSQRHPWEVVLEHGLGDVVREAIPLSLEEPIISQEWAQADLAVDHSGAQRVGQVCELLKCRRFNDDDPVIRMLPGNDLHLKRFLAYNHVIRRYREARGLRQTDKALTQWYQLEIETLQSSVDSSW